MYTFPEVVLAATDRVCEFYYEANEKFFRQADQIGEGSLVRVIFPDEIFGQPCCWQDDSCLVEI